MRFWATMRGCRFSTHLESALGAAASRHGLGGYVASCALAGTRGQFPYGDLCLDREDDSVNEIRVRSCMRTKVQNL